MNIILASNNAGKIREFRSLLHPFALEVIPQAELQVTEVEETAPTFIENALIKARHASQLTGLPALADDSGLAVTALHGAPGIYSARYAGPRATSADNIAKLLNELKDVPAEQRHASFHCVLVYLSHAEDPTPLVCHGQWHGILLTTPRGEQGFGYDPIFYVPSENKSAAELSPELKNKMSHRGLALASLIKKLPEKIHESAFS